MENSSEFILFFIPNHNINKKPRRQNNLDFPHFYPNFSITKPHTNSIADKLRPRIFSENLCSNEIIISKKKKSACNYSNFSHLHEINVCAPNIN